MLPASIMTMRTQGLIVCKLSDNMRIKLRIASAYLQLSSNPQSSGTCVSLASVGHCEVRIFAGLVADSDGLPLFWLELFDHGANASVDGSCSHSIEDAVTVFDDFVAQATRLESGGDGPKTLT